MTDENVSVPTQTPLVGLQMDADTATYVGVLEGTIAALIINECKYRALLELFTGESWEATKIDVNGSVLKELAISTLVRQTGMDIARAKVLVNKRWNRYNVESPAVLPKAVPIEELSKDSLEKDSVATGLLSKDGQKMSSRLSAWKERQMASAATISDEEVSKVVAGQELSDSQ